MSMTISIDDQLKNEFTEICNEIGMSASTAFTIFAKRVVREKGIPFSLSSQTDDARNLEQQGRYYERQLADLAWRGYEEALAGEGRTLDEVSAARKARQVVA